MFVFYPTVQNLHAGNITQTTRYMNAPEAKACRFIRELRKEGKKSYFAQAWCKKKLALVFCHKHFKKRNAKLIENEKNCNFREEEN